MQIKKNRAVHFAIDGKHYCGTVVDFTKFEDESILIDVNVRGMVFMITNDDIILKPSPRWCD